METLPRRGYRFVAPVERVAAPPREGGGRPAGPLPAAASGPRSGRTAATVGTAAILLFTAAALLASLRAGLDPSEVTPASAESPPSARSEVPAPAPPAAAASPWEPDPAARAAYLRALVQQLDLVTPEELPVSATAHAPRPNHHAG